MIVASTTRKEAVAVTEAEPVAAAVLAAMTADYTAIREEIMLCMNQQKDMMNLAILLLAGVLTLIGKIATGGSSQHKIGLVLLLAPIPYALLASYTANRSRRIVLMAQYVCNDLRRRAEAITGVPGLQLWRWEDFKAASYNKANRLEKIDANVIDVAPSLIFLGPPVVAYVAYVKFLGVPSGGRAALAIAVGTLTLAACVRILKSHDEARGISIV
jgi:hypothetical protein